MNQTLSNAAGLLLFNSGYVYRLLRKEAERIGVRWTQITLLKDIELLTPVTQKELAQANHLSGPSVSIAVKEMIKLGLVERKINPNDKRSATLALTTLGQQQLQNDGAKLQACLAPVLEQLASSELDLLVDAESALAKVFANRFDR